MTRERKHAIRRFERKCVSLAAIMRESLIEVFFPDTCSQKVHFGRFSLPDMHTSTECNTTDEAGSENLISSFRKYGCAFLTDPLAMQREASVGGFTPYIAGMNFCAEFG
eukprot:8217119-Pyramimonas_sp.AAC.1